MWRMASVVVLVASTLGCDKAVQPREARCERRSVCGDQAGPTPGDQGYCAEALADPTCGPPYLIALACVQQREACTTDGRRDVVATDDACAAEVAAALVNPACLIILGQDAGIDSDAAP